MFIVATSSNFIFMQCSQKLILSYLHNYLFYMLHYITSILT